MSTDPPRGRTRRLALSIGVPAVILVGLVLISGGSFFGGGSGATTPPAPAQNATVAPAATATAPVSGQVQGTVTTSVHHTNATYTFVYTVRDTGKSPLAGFQLNGLASNLFALQGPAGWSRFGSGVCHGKYPGVLIYWSTNSASRAVIRPGAGATFSFRVRTRGVAAASYSLSFGNARPQFGIVRVPAPSTLPVPGACSR